MVDENEGTQGEQGAPSVVTAPVDEVKGPKITRSRAKDGSRVLGISPSSVPMPNEQARKYYWCGLTPDAPRTVIHFGGFDFNLFRKRQEQTEDDEFKSVLSPTKYAGRVHHMTDSQVEWVLRGVANRVVRNNPTRDVATLNGGRKAFRSMEGDRPMGEFVYMIEVEDPTTINRGMGDLMDRVTTLLPRK